MPQNYSHSAPSQRPQNHNPTPPTPLFDLSQIKFGQKELDAELFNSIVQKAAQWVASDRNANKPTQLRRFYNEILLWESKVRQQPDRFNEYLPFIRMINAKVAYAKGRDLVDDSFLKLLEHTLKAVNDDKSMGTCKLFWEAFMGFYKLERPRD